MEKSFLVHNGFKSLLWASKRIKNTMLGEHFFFGVLCVKRGHADCKILVCKGFFCLIWGGVFKGKDLINCSIWTIVVILLNKILKSFSISKPGSNIRERSFSYCIFFKMRFCPSKNMDYTSHYLQFKGILDFKCEW